MKIGLLTTLNHNIGDDFIREGLLHVIRTLRPNTDFRLVPINKHQPHTILPPWHPARFARAIGPRLPRGRITLGRFANWAQRALRASRFDGCDMVIQCGTPVLWENCRWSEWADPIWRAVLARLDPATPLLNLGAGSCYPWERQPLSLVGNADEEFIRLMLVAARCTSVRDPLAATLFQSLGAQTALLACPAVLAGQAFVEPKAPDRRVLVNYMPNGAHSRWDQDIDAQAWEQTMRAVVIALERDWQPVILCHNECELEIAARLRPDLPRVAPSTPREYFELANGAAFGVFNRLHAGVALAGIGIPSVCVGTDTRMLMVQQIGLPICYVREATTDKILAAVRQLAAARMAESNRLLQLRAATFQGYSKILSPWLGPVSR